jgi:hypothetical protein
MNHSRLFKPSVRLAMALLAVVCLRGQGAEVRHRILAADYSTKRMAIVDAGGNIEWETSIRDIHDMHVLPNGNILCQLGWTRVVEISPDKEIVWSYDSSKSNGNEGKRVEVHAFQPLADGRIMIVESGPGRILEIDRKGKIHREIALKRNSPSAHSDTRMARKTDAGTYLVCQESDGAVREYNASGSVIWDYPVPLFGREPKPGHGPEAFGNSVFGAIRLDNGNTLIATGNGHSLIEVTPSKEIVWAIHQDDLPGIRLAWVTTVAQMPNGNIVFGNCHAGPDNPQIIEVTRDKKVVWTFKDFEHFGNALPVSLVLDVGGRIIR